MKGRRFGETHRLAAREKLSNKQTLSLGSFTINVRS
jgi:hypothetical protein